MTASTPKLESKTLWTSSSWTKSMAVCGHGHGWVNRVVDANMFWIVWHYRMSFQGQYINCKILNPGASMFNTRALTCLATGLTTLLYTHNITWLAFGLSIAKRGPRFRTIEISLPHHHTIIAEPVFFTKKSVIGWLFVGNWRKLQEATVRHSWHSGSFEPVPRLIGGLYIGMWWNVHRRKWLVTGNPETEEGKKEGLCNW